jgi:hypothetical protein
MIKEARIGRLSNGKYRVYSRTGKNLGTYTSYSGAKKRLAEVEMFKHMDKKKKRASALLSLMSIYKQAENNPEVTTTYSAFMRELRKNNPKLVPSFMKAFKDAFDRAMDDNLEEAENAALLEAMQTVEVPHDTENV